MHYVVDGEPDSRESAAGRHSRIVMPSGDRFAMPRTLARIRSLVIPPAWNDVWIASARGWPHPGDGPDARGRKQHRYHPEWTARAAATRSTSRWSTSRVALPAIRRRVRVDLRKAPLSREHVLATVVQLLEKTLIRIGNKEYARANKSFGLTTLLDEHVQVKGSSVKFQFRAKSGVMQTIELEDATLARIVQRCRTLPGKAFFQYLDENGKAQCIDSVAVNGYLRQITGHTFTAKTSEPGRAPCSPPWRCATCPVRI